MRTKMERVRTLQENLSPNMLPWLGMSVPFTFIAQLFGTVPETSPLCMFLASPYPAFIAVCLIVATGLTILEGSNLTRACDLIACVLMLVSALLIFPEHASSATMLAMGMELGGAGVAWFYLRWGRLYAQLEIRRAAGIICLSVASAGLLKLLITVLGSFETLVLEVTLVVAGGASISMAERNAADGNVTSTTKHTARPLSLHDLWAFPVALVVLCATLGMLYNVPHASRSGVPLMLGYLFESMAAIIVFWWICLHKRAVNIVGTAASLAVVIATGTFALSMLGPQVDAAFSLCTNIDHSLLTLFLWIILTDLARRLDAPVQRVFAVGWIMRSLPFWLAGRLTKLVGLALTSDLCNLVTYLVVLTLAIVLAGNSTSAQRVLAGLRGNALGGDRASIDRSCAQIADRYALTQRETDVLALLACGDSRPHIAEVLDLSENTVRGYTKALYKKLEIHDRQALYALVNGTTPGAGGI